jgi:hypothetical protein
LSRHGARLDAADKQWHLSSPTPYDPPLTYGGWSQSRALGQRIANILRTRETDDEVIAPLDDNGHPGGDRTKRRHKVIIHSSPFLRCVQTSIGISAGLAQNPGHSAQRPRSSNSTTGKAMHSSPRIRPTINTGSPSLAPIPEPVMSVRKTLSIRKSTIRIDAFLGEWLSPDYFALITPPPNSLMMVAGAKADLLRREDYSALARQEVVSGGHQKPFPGGWGSPIVSAEHDKDEGPLSSMSALGQALHRRDRTGSLSSVETNGSHQSQQGGRGGSPSPSGAEHGVYEPPVPNYAISASDPIPQGYVAHSRDACVNIDYQWDSMREPQLWGSGGEYGEEWSSMHKRFRKGLQQMVGWYQNEDNPGKDSKLSTANPSTASSPGQDETSDDEDTDLVLILVTHAAGCNALIGALTNQPVLLDVGMTSLTMAVRKPTSPKTPTTTPGATETWNAVSVSDEYDVKLIANTEHLRNSSVSSTPTISRSSSVVSGSFRERFGSTSALFDPNKARPITASGALGGVRRTASIASSQPRSYVPTRQSSVGLWGSTPVQEKGIQENEASPKHVSFGTDGIIDQSATEDILPLEKPTIELEKEDTADVPEEDEVAPLGLWGSPRPPGVAERNRELGPKRRWTVNERN